MSSLGDFFPGKHRKEFSARKIRIGYVIRCKVFDTNPPKIKRFIIIGESDDKLLIGCIYINTEINPKIFPDHALRDLHLELQAEGR